MAEINGKLIGQKILDQTRERVTKLEVEPSLVVVMVGNNAVSASYVQRKARAAEYIGVKFEKRQYSQKISNVQLIEELGRLQDQFDGVIVQLPLPDHLDTFKILDTLKPEKDVDCLSSKSLGMVMRGTSKVLPPTIGAIMEICKHCKVNLKNKHVVIVGQGELVGKPAMAVFSNLPVTLTICGLGTKDLERYIKQADVLITGTGKAGLIKKGSVKKGSLVIDAGTSFVKGKLVGDVDPQVWKIAKYFTPVPGGVGPITVAKLFENLITLQE